MYRALPRGNKLCAQKEEERRQSLHRNKLREIRSTLDTKAPEVMKLDHLRTNAKREQQLDERFMEIDRSNRILLQKMGEIMNPNKKVSSAVAVPGAVPGAVPVAVPGPRSLNAASRKKEFDRITNENLHILKRIQRAQPMYDHVKWEQHHRAHMSRLKNCAEFPVVLEHPLQSQTSAGLSQHQSRQPSAVPLTSAGAAAGQSQPQAQPRLDSPTQSGAAQTSQQLAHGGNSSAVHKEGRKFGERYYLLEMATDGRALTVSAYDGESQQTLELVVNEKNHRKYFRECHGDYSLLAKRVKVANGSNRLFIEDAL